MPEFFFFPGATRSFEQSPRYRKITFQPLEKAHLGFISAFPRFQTISEVTLAPRHDLIPERVGHGSYILVPVVGSIEVSLDTRVFQVGAGQLAIVRPEWNQQLRFTHPLDTGLIYYLEIRLDVPDVPKNIRVFDLKLKHDNILKTLPLTKTSKLAIGKYQGRQSGEFLISPAAAAFVFVIHGAFEFANRLMEAGDGLGIYHPAGKLDFEALAGESIIVIIYTA